MNVRSSLSSLTARLPRYASDVNPAPKSSIDTPSPRRMLGTLICVYSVLRIGIAAVGRRGLRSVAMPLLSARLLVPVAVVILAWGGIHVLSSHNIAVSPAVWPAAPSTPSSAPGRAAAGPAVPGAATAPPSPSPGGDAGIPILPGALQQLNGSTRDTAVGVYSLIQQLERALRSHLEQLAGQLEPGR